MSKGSRQQLLTRVARMGRAGFSWLMMVILTSQLVLTPGSALALSDVSGDSGITYETDSYEVTGEDGYTDEASGQADGSEGDGEAIVDEVVTRTASEFAGTASFTTTWDDNDDAAGKRPATDSDQLAYQLQYRHAGSSDEWVAFRADDSSCLEALGVSSEQAAAISVSVMASSASYVASAKELPSKVSLSNGGEESYEWRVTRTGEVEGYQKIDEADGTETLQLVGDESADTEGEQQDPSYSFTNAFTGTKDVTFCAHWHDQYVKATLNQRPDVYLTLYRVVDGEPQVVSGYETYEWTGLSEWNGASVDADYCQSATIKNLPKYDSSGAEIVYYAVATPSVSDAAFKALDYTGIENGHANNDYNWAVWRGVSDEAKNADETINPSSASFALREGGTFVFRVSNSVTVQGTKAWTNIPGEYTGSMPDITVFLQQRVVGDSTSWSSLGVSETGSGSYDEINGKYYVLTNKDKSYKADPDAKSAVAWKTISGSADKTSSFTIGNYGDNGSNSTTSGGELDKYDAEGRLYEYRACEITDGLIKDGNNSPAGGFTVSQLIKAISGMSEAGVSPANNCYAEASLTSSSDGLTFRIDNAFKTNQDYSIVIYKTFTGRSSGDKYPTVTFTLSRRLGSGEWTKVGEEALDTSNPSTMPGYEFCSLYFTNLARYAPNGERYEYKVEESSLEGYETYAAQGIFVNEDDERTSTVDGLYPEVDPVTYEDMYTSSAAFLNKYVADQVDISGTKDWGDSDNAFGTRDDIYSTLTLTRYYKSDPSKTEEVTLQTDDSTAEGYFAWTSDTSGSNAYTSFKISNLEKWAPDGTAWVYKLKEDSSKVAADSTLNQYEFKRSEVTTTADSPTFPALQNNLKNKVSVVKEFTGDGGDTAYQQRPRVYVTLQASTDGGTTWQAASDVLGVSEAGGKAFVQSWTPSSKSRNSWNFTWDQLPSKVGEKTVTYRAVESKLAYDAASSAGSEAQVVTPSVDANGTYSNVTGPYVPSQSTSSSGDVTTTYIVNKLEGSTSLAVTKNWNDDDNSLGVRQNLTFLLQRKTADGEWRWVTKYGATVTSPFDAAGTALNDSLVKLALNGSMSGTDTWEKTFSNLPSCDASGAAYTYRAVEVVPGGYSVTGAGATEVAKSGSLSLYTVEDGVFNNTLSTCDLQGSKEWATYGLDRPTDPSSVKLVLQQYKGADDKNPATISADKYTVEWSDLSSSSWTYTIKGLPKTAGDGTQYYYRVTEAADSVAGYYPSNPTDVATEQDGKWVNGPITNYATRLSFDTAGAVGSEAAQLNGVEFAVYNSSREKVAVWGRNAAGATYVKETKGCSSSTSVDTGITYIVGLPAGSYTVTETKTPANYVSVGDIVLTLGSDGTVSTDATTAEVANPEGSGKANLVTVTDDVLRGTFSVTKVFGNDAVSGMTFDLYKADGTLIATGLTTDDNGRFSSEGSSIAYASDAGLGSNYTALSDGLPEGSYYLLETGEKDDLVKPSGDAAKTEFTVAPNSVKAKQPDPANLRIENAEFNAEVTLSKTDATSGEAVSGAVFKLEYKATGASGYTTLGEDYKTDANGKLTLSGLKKGSYKLTEVSNTGYEVADGGTKVAEFVIDNADAGKSFDLGKDADREAIEATEVDATITAEGSTSMTNERLLGSLTMSKTDDAGKPLAGTTFKLQVRTADGTAWNDVTGTDGKVRSFTTNEQGAITATGLDWGTYRFVETTPTPGYHAQGEDGQAVSGEATITRENVAASIEKPLSCGSLSNSKVAVTLAKADSAGRAITSGSATFEITPLAGSAFADGTSTAKSYATSTATGSVAVSGELVVGGRYSIRETLAPAGYKLNSAALEVEVTASGGLAVMAEAAGYALSDDGLTVTASDEAIDPISVELSVSKLVDGLTAANASKEFEFELFDQSGNKVEGVDNVTAKAGDTVSFSGITYTPADAGKTFTYVIHELRDEDGQPGDGSEDGDGSEQGQPGEGSEDGDGTVAGTGWTYADDVKVTVTVTEVPGTKLEAKVTYGNETSDGSSADGDTTDGDVTDGSPVDPASALFGALGLGGGSIGDSPNNGSTNADGSSDQPTSAVFTNVYRASGRATVSLTKTVNGSTDVKPDELFEFQLLDENGEVLDTLTTKQGVLASFGELAYTQADDGKAFTYTVHEVGHDTDGWTVAPDVTVSVKVADSGDGTMTAEVSYSNGTEAAEFDDTYVEPVTPDDEPSGPDDEPSGPGGESAGSDDESAGPDGKQVPQTGDSYGALATTAACLAAAGLALIATTLHRSRRRQ